MRLILLRRAIALAVLAGMICSHLPVPAAVPVESTQPFPCQTKACGCRTAEQSLKRCCCFTKAQKLAWAKKHGVSVPVELASAGKKKASGCCSQKSGTSCCSKKKPTAQDARPVVALQQDECRGRSWSWTALPWLISEPARSIVLRDCEPGAVFLATSEVAPQGGLRPPVPPPRAA